jgi:hypothetical protein
LTAQKQVDELGHFEIVDLDRGFIRRRDHQVRLDCSFQPYVPSRDSIHATSRQICSFEVGADQSRPAEVRPLEFRPDKVRPVEVRPAEVRLFEDRVVEERPEKVRPVEVRPVEVCQVEVRPPELRVDEVRQHLRVLFSPLTPRLESFLKLCEMFGIRQGAHHEYEAVRDFQSYICA